jgi:hypothetical protein
MLDLPRVRHVFRIWIWTSQLLGRISSTPGDREEARHALHTAHCTLHTADLLWIFFPMSLRCMHTTAQQGKRRCEDLAALSRPSVCEASTQPRSSPASRLVCATRRACSWVGACTLAGDNTSLPHHPHKRSTPLWDMEGGRTREELKIPAMSPKDCKLILAFGSCFGNPAKTWRRWRRRRMMRRGGGRGEGGEEEERGAEGRAQETHQVRAQHGRERERERERKEKPSAGLAGIHTNGTRVMEGLCVQILLLLFDLVYNPYGILTYTSGTTGPIICRQYSSQRPSRKFRPNQVFSR